MVTNERNSNSRRGYSGNNAVATFRRSDNDNNSRAFFVSPATAAATGAAATNKTAAFVSAKPNNDRVLRFRRQNCFFRTSREEELKENSFERESDSLVYSSASSSESLSSSLDEDSLAAFLSCSSSLGSSLRESIGNEQEDSPPTVAASSTPFASPAAAAGSPSISRRAVRFSDDPPVVHAVDRPTEQEKRLLYYTATDYQVIMARYYIEQIREAEEMELRKTMTTMGGGTGDCLFV